MMLHVHPISDVSNLVCNVIVSNAIKETVENVNLYTHLMLKKLVSNLVMSNGQLRDHYVYMDN